MDVVAKWPGSTHDAFIWNMSGLRELFFNGKLPECSWLLGDNGYPSEPWLLTPLLETTSIAQERYNICHRKTSSVIEQCNGLLKSRFRCLNMSGGTLLYSPEKVCGIIVASVILHNICIKQNSMGNQYCYQ